MLLGRIDTFFYQNSLPSITGQTVGGGPVASYYANQVERTELDHPDPRRTECAADPFIASPSFGTALQISMLLFQPPRATFFILDTY